jgi:N-acetyl-anhydromuramyl-L-alanine amidase AmpD
MSLQISWLANNNFFPGRDGQKPLYIILHGTAGGTTAQAIAQYFQSTQGTANPVTSHYVIGPDGEIVQCVSELNGAWANGVLTPGHAAFWDAYAGINPNNLTVSIEHVKASSDNSDLLTPAQKSSSFALIQDICNRNNIPKHDADKTGGITGHFSLDPVNRADCPGTYPWSDLWAYLQGTNTMQQQFQDVWIKNARGIPMTTGIGNTLIAAFNSGKIAATFPLQGEIDTVDWGGNHIKWQSFSSGIHAEYNVSTGHCCVYDAQNGKLWG